MIDRPKGGERTVLVQLALPGIQVEKALAEFEELALSAGAEIVGTVRGARSSPEVKYFMGTGKAEEVLEVVKAFEAELVLVNHELSPSQERNLERFFSCRVVGRSGLILDIFASRAQTFEGKLQVELAQLKHMSTRLIRGWTHLERQKGGIGLRGPGETQLETDRRLLRERIKYITQRLDKVRKTREENRRNRQKSGLPTLSLVGYTNAGKSTLFNCLTGEEGFVADMLFATLDPTMRKITLPGELPAILADTVGFISDLPHHLVEAFRATLEETCHASLLLHVIDISNPDRESDEAAVESVLTDIGAHEIPILKVFNKIDQYTGPLPEEEHAVFVSAKTGEGIENLKSALVSHFQGEALEEDMYVPVNQAKLRAWLYKMQAVRQETMDEAGGWHMTVRLTEAQRKTLREFLSK